MFAELEGEDVRVFPMYGGALTFTDWLHQLREPPEGFAGSKVARRHWEDGNPVEWAINDYVYYNLRE
jgi:hypothetical protein